jgi:hypothetical protein
MSKWGAVENALIGALFDLAPINTDIRELVIRKSFQITHRVRENASPKKLDLCVRVVREQTAKEASPGFCSMCMCHFFSS